MSGREKENPVLRLTLFTDYICPFCYIGDLRLRELRSEYNVMVNFRFLEIHPETPAEGISVESLDYSEKQRRMMMGGLAKMAKQEGVDLQSPARIVNSHRALLLAEAAKEAGREAFYALNSKLFEAYFLDGKNISDSEVLEEIALTCGMSKSLVEQAWTNPAYANVLRNNRVMAMQAGVTGTPTFFIGQRRLSGAVEKEVLQDAARTAVVDQE
jgi:predicted DsbA family dithiol-disulfide isomerase